MLSVLPPLYPDELLYSLYARYKRWLGYECNTAVFADLFGAEGRGRSCLASLDHDHADLFFKNVYITWVGSYEEIVSSFTTRRYLTAFEFHRDPDFDAVDSSFARYSKTRHLHGNSAVRVTALGYCQECLVSDCYQFGEPYWHRSHQLRGVFVCSKHTVFLEYLQIQRRRKGIELMSPPWPDPENMQPSESVDFSNPEHQLLLQIATDSSWLLTHGLARTQQDNIRAFYDVALKYSYAHRYFEPLFRETYSGEFLAAVGLHAAGWGRTTVERVWRQHSTPTLAHILVFYALGLDFRAVCGGKTVETALNHLSIERDKGVLGGVCKKASDTTAQRQRLPVEKILGLDVNSRLGLCSAVRARFSIAAPRRHVR